MSISRPVSAGLRVSFVDLGWDGAVGYEGWDTKVVCLPFGYIRIMLRRLCVCHLVRRLWYEGCVSAICPVCHLPCHLPLHPALGIVQQGRAEVVIRDCPRATSGNLVVAVHELQTAVGGVVG